MPVLLSVLLLSTVAASPRDTLGCAEAARFVRTDRRMVAELEPDTLDDWRTRKRLVGCRITAAGLSDVTVREEAARFFERLRSAGWVRSPDPMDAPNEASLRFRKSNRDCLFGINAQPLLGTDAEGRVNDAVVPKAGETRYQLLVQCFAAMPAAPR